MPPSPVIGMVSALVALFAEPAVQGGRRWTTRNSKACWPSCSASRSFSSSLQPWCSSSAGSSC